MSDYQPGSYDQQQQGAVPPKPDPAVMPSDDERLWATLAHISPLVLPIFGPLIIWMIKKEESPFVEDQAKEALNFELTLLIAYVILGATCVGLFLAPIVAVAGLVYHIIAAMEANKGNRYRYDYIWRLVT